jgi:serine/threonine-protein kinase
MGIVYKARHRTLGRVVALKTMQADALARPELAERFDREARAAARLDHPHIVPIYEVGRHQGRPYYTMALADGSLAQHAGRFTADPRAAAGLMEKVARAVHHAHQHGILHRDLKPGNILLDGRGEPLVSDFGLAKILDDEVELTRSGELLGTPAYMAPEQAAGGGQPVTGSADVWALGVFLYELLTGRRPFLGPSRDQVLHQIRTAEPARPRQLRPDLDPTLEAIILKCLAKDPARRYASAGALADDLGRWRRGEPAAVRPRPPARRLLRVAAVVAVAAVGLAAVVAALNRGGGAPERPGPEAAPVVLLGAAGPPTKPFAWLFGGKGAAAEVTGPDKRFTVRTRGVCALSLADSPPWPAYRLEAEVRHDEGDREGVGLCFGYRTVSSGQKTFALGFTLAFADRGQHKGSLGFHVRGLPEGSPWPTRKDPCLTLAGYPPPDLGKPPPWRRLAVEVTPDQTRFYWKGDGEEKCVGGLSRAELREKAAGLFEGLEGASWDEVPHGGLGLFVEAGAASFRQVVLRPLP